MRLGRPKRVALLAVAAVCIVVAALALARREQIAFTAKCWGNGNQLPVCACVYNALAELPGNYRALAVSWAHDSGTAYAAGVMQLVAAEAWRVVAARIEHVPSIGDKRDAIRSWVWRTADAMGWIALREAAPSVAAYLSSAATMLPVIDDAFAEFARAQAVVGRHCGRERTYLVRVYEARTAAGAKLEALTAVALDVAADAAQAGKASAERGATTTVRVWTWVRSWL